MTELETRALTPTHRHAQEPVEGELYVVFRVADMTLALAARGVLQMESYAGATAVPGAPPFVAGIMQLRGRVVPVIDLRVRFGMPAAVAGFDTRVVVGEHEGRAIALVTDAAREVIRIADAQLEPPPPLLATGAGRFVAAVAHLGDRTVLVLDFSKVIGEEASDV